MMHFDARVCGLGHQLAVEGHNFQVKRDHPCTPCATAGGTGTGPVGGESGQPMALEAEEPEVRFEQEDFPSGAKLQVATGATGPDQEHWDPHATGLPLLATGPSTHALRLSANFTVGELVRSGGRVASVARISPRLVRVLQAIRDRAGRPLRITSGYRSWARNIEVYRARNQRPTLSRHCSGQAADITIAGLTGTEIARLAIDAAGPDLAIGVGANYAHIDVRGTWTLWAYLGGDAGTTAKSAVQAHRDGHMRGILPVLDLRLEVPMSAQQTGMSCWAAGASMVVGWRDKVSIDPREIARAAGAWAQYRDGLLPEDASIFPIWGMVPEPPQSYTVEAFYQLLDRYGPLWVAAAMPSAHIRVVTGMVGDGSPDGTTVFINDPWELGMTDFRLPNAGAQYTETYAQFVARTEKLAIAEDVRGIYVAHALDPRRRF